jgi:glycosyltransferase involved in cell wall biosynthesis
MLSMRIGIDYTAAVRQGAGIGRYTRQLVHALVALDTKNQYVLLAAGGGSGGVPGSQVAERALESSRGLSGVSARGNVHSVNLPVSDRAMATLWHRLRLPLPVELFCGALDVFHSPDFTLPPVRRARTVLTVHDLSFMRVPQCSDPRLRSYLLQAVPTSVRRADVVLADSECTKADAIELLGVDPAHVEVIYPGVERRFQPAQDAHALDAVRSRYRLPERFVLGLGTLQPRKNFERLIEAYARFKEEAGSEVNLVIAGGAGWMYEGIFRRVEELGVQDAVCFPGYVADEDLPALYTLADLFVFPSLYEGFGLPPLEAMACGTPVVTSNVSSLPEVAGDAALMVDPLDVAALAEAIQCVLKDTDLRDRIVRQGQEQARRFTWSGAARKLLGVYERIGSSRHE